MLRVVVGDLILQMKSGLRKTTEIRKYFICFLPYVVLSLKRISEVPCADDVMFFMRLAMPLLAAWFMKSCPNRLEKSMFLCPMTVLERRRYMIIVYWVRVFFLAAIFFCIEFIGMWFLDMPRRYIVGMMVSEFFLVLVLCLFGEDDFKEYRCLQKRSAIGTVVAVIMVILVYCMTYAEIILLYWVQDKNSYFTYFYWGCILIQLVCTVYSMSRNFSARMDTLQNFEDMYVIKSQ